MSCKVYSLFNSGTTEIYFNYQRCDDNMLEYQIPLQPNETKKIWLLDGTFGIDPFFSNDLIILVAEDFPPIRPTPTPTPTPSNTPGLSPTPTPTPSITPSATPIPFLLPNDVVFADNVTNNIYGYTPSANTIQYLFNLSNSNTILDIANTTDKIFINYDNGEIDEYSFVSYPFSASYSTTYNFSGSVGVSLFAIDNNFLLLGSDKIEKLNLSALTSSTLFTLSAACENCTSTGTLLYYPTLDQYFINYFDTETDEHFVSLFDNSGNTISVIDLSLFIDPVFPNANQILGSFTSNDIIYGISYDMEIYEISFSTLTLLGPVQPINLTSEKCVGSGISIDSVSWTLPAPIFEY